MQSKRFVAADMRRALTLVRDDLGEDAMILSTQRTAKGVEIVATSEALPAPTTMPPAAAKQVQAPQALKGLASGKTKEELALELEMARRRMMAVKKEENMTLGDWAKKEEPSSPHYAALEKPQLNQWLKETPAVQQPKSTPQQQLIETQVADNKVRDNEEIRRLQDEISSMRNVFETQLAAIAESQERSFQDQQALTDIVPVVVDVKQRLNGLGLTKACNDQVIRSLKSIDEQSMNEESLWAESLAKLARSIPSVTTDPVATGGIYAFLGTTGVGKTTTIAKFAARHVMEHQ